MFEVTGNEVRRIEMGFAASVLTHTLCGCNPSKRAASLKNSLGSMRAFQCLFESLLPAMPRAPMSTRRGGVTVDVLGLPPQATS
jgi:hypothetical protein